jgi:predicted dienelactone hydrolase
MKRVTGIGGIFFSANDPVALRAWYKTRVQRTLSTPSPLRPPLIRRALGRFQTMEGGTRELMRFVGFVFVAATVLLPAQIGSPAPAAGQVGFRQFQLPKSDKGRKVEVAVWYPTTSKRAATVVGQNVIFVGQLVCKDAPIAAGRHSLVMLSHGYSGNWTNQSWLAEALVHRGYVVAAVNHPGTTTLDMDVAAGAQMWERPRDVSRAIDALTQDPPWSDVVSTGRVAAIGHSFGGWTVIELAGGRFDPTLFEADCKNHEILASCQVYRRIGAGKDTAARSALGQNLRDPRIQAVISLDLGLARGFDPDSLAHVNVPVLVIGAAAPNPQVPAELESRHLFELLPVASARYVEIAGAAHFSFLPICRPGAAALLAEDSPEDVVVCLDREGASRETIHRQTASEIIHFLAATVPPYL